MGNQKFLNYVFTCFITYKYEALRVAKLQAKLMMRYLKPKLDFGHSFIHDLNIQCMYMILWQRVLYRDFEYAQQKKKSLFSLRPAW